MVTGLTCERWRVTEVTEVTVEGYKIEVTRQEIGMTECVTKVNDNVW